MLSGSVCRYVTGSVCPYVTSMSRQSVTNSFTTVGSDICKISTKKSIFLGGFTTQEKREKVAKFHSQERRSSDAPALLQRHYSAATAPLKVGVAFIKIPKNLYKKVQIFWGFRKTGNER